MFDTTRRKFLLGTIGGLFAAPMIVRAGSIMPVRALILPEAITYNVSDSLAYEYWAIGPMGLAKYTAKQILDAPKGVYLPWLPEDRSRGSTDSYKAFRPVYENKKGLIFGQIGKEVELRNIADQLDRDPVIVKLRGEQDELLRKLRSSRREAEEARQMGLRKVHLA